MLTCNVSYSALNTGKGYVLETLFGLKKFYSVHLFGADRTIQVSSTIQPNWGKKKNENKIFISQSGTYFVWIYFYVLLSRF